MNRTVLEAKSQTVRHAGPTADRYQAAMVQYLAAVSGHTDVAATHGPSLFADLRWKLPNVHVNDVMTSAVITVGPETPFREIVETLARNGITAVPVLDADDRVVGIVSHSDLLAKVAAGGEAHPHLPGSLSDRHEAVRKSRGETASDLMTAPAITVAPSATVIEAARTAARARVHHLPVIDHRGVLVGIVARSDLLRVFLREDADIRQHIINELVHHFAIDTTAVEVQVDDGVVTLTGQVERRLLIKPILQAVRTTTGVVATIDQLTYAFDDTIFPAPKPLV